MSTKYAQHFSTLATPQSEPIPGKVMAPNHAGGFGFEVNDWTRLNRFLVIGSEGNSYYQTEKALTIENAQCVLRCLDLDAERTVRTIVEISDAGRAPKNDPAIFALAIAAGHPKGKVFALAAIPKVCRIPTHTYAFCEAVEKFRGWGKGLRRAIAGLYLDRLVEQLAFHVAKYQSRNGWSHRDLLRLSHPKTDDPARQAVLRWAVGGKDALGSRQIARKPAKPTLGVDAPTVEYGSVAGHLPRLLQAVDEAKSADRAGIVKLIINDKLPRECIPTEHLNDPTVWEALLLEMPLTAMIRNLGKMSAVGLLKPMSDAVKVVCGRLADQDYIRKSRVHPMAILLAAKTYGQGHGEKGKLSWSAVSQINDALDSAFYLSFGNVEPANKRTLICLDVSGSMGSQISGMPLSCREAAAAMAMITAKTEPAYGIMAFATQFVPLNISGCSRLSDVIARTSNLPFGGTDCAIPMIWALEKQIGVDTFVTLTDNETWAGRGMHPCQALQQYRQRMSIASKMVVSAFTATQISIADPMDSGTLDVCGLDSSTSALISDFSAGRI